MLAPRPVATAAPTPVVLMKSRRVTVPPPIGYSSFFDARGHARAPCAERLRRWDHTTANKFYALSHGAVKLLPRRRRSEEHTSELQSQFHLVCRLLLEKK